LGVIKITLHLKSELSNEFFYLETEASIIDAAFDVLLGRPDIKKHNLVVHFPSQFRLVDTQLRSSLAERPVNTHSAREVSPESDKRPDPSCKPKQARGNVERVLFMNVKSKEELLGDTPENFEEEWLKQPPDIATVLPALNPPEQDPLELIGFHGSPELQSALKTLCYEYRHIFSTTLRPKHANVPAMQLHVNRDEWVQKTNRRGPRPLSVKKMAALDEQINELLRLGIIKQSKAVAWSQILLVPKPNGKLRLCIDFRALNKASRGEHWPIPVIDHLLTRLGRRKPKLFAKMDFTSGFWQTIIDESVREFTAFMTYRGLYEWTRVPMGLKGAPSYFQQQMSSVLNGLLYLVCELYIDDVIVDGSDDESLLRNLRAVFQRLSDKDITVNPNKCDLGMTDTEFVGHVVDGDGKRMSAEKIQKVLNFAKPTTVKELRSFLGLVNYVRDHIRDHSKLVQPLFSMLKKTCGSGKLTSNKRECSGRTVVWGTDENVAFTAIVDAIAVCPKLYFLDEAIAGPRDIILCTDASDYGYGAYLAQKYGAGLEHERPERPIGFYSQTFTRVQLNWSVPEKEGFGIYSAILHFEHLLRDRHFILKTDHKNLTFIKDSGSPKVIRWKLAIQEYDFDIEHIEGKDNTVADFFSRVKPEAFDSP
jgi:hypothetical protein